MQKPVAERAENTLFSCSFSSFRESRRAWPPVAAQLTDLLRASVLFDDAYQLVAFLAFMQRRFRVVRVKNRFEHVDPSDPGAFRNVHTNLRLGSGGLVVEVQLHLRAFFHASRALHVLYEVARAAEPAEVRSLARYARARASPQGRNFAKLLFRGAVTLRTRGPRPAVPLERGEVAGGARAGGAGPAHAAAAAAPEPHAPGPAERARSGGGRGPRRRSRPCP